MNTLLTPKQLKFVSEYLRLGNGVEAARAAGYKGNANTLAVVSAENLRKPNIQSALVKHVDSTGVTEKHISNEIAKVAFSEASDPLRNDHKLKALQLLAKIKGMTTNVKQTNVVGTMQLIQFRSGKPENETAKQVLSV
jgi:hypothetical protein